MAEDEKTPEELAQDAAQKAFEAAMPAPGAPLMAARIGDPHICPLVDGVKPHVGGPVTVGCPTVMICGMPAARIGDAVTCVGPPDAIAKGSMTVKIGSMPAARLGDMTVHGGVIVLGAPTVFIGDIGMGGVGSTNGGCMSSAKKAATPLIKPAGRLA
jgi:uncharacterized Zn-binding protein involved in type VI secretion